jgi:hypothetical protein
LGTLTNESGHVFEVHRERKVFADRGDDVFYTPISRRDALRRPVEPSAYLFQPC